MINVSQDIKRPTYLDTDLQITKFLQTQIADTRSTNIKI